MLTPPLSTAPFCNAAPERMLPVWPGWMPTPVAFLLNSPVTTFSRIRDWAASHHLARLSFWAVNRDHPCPTGVHAGDTCSGIAQNDWDFTRINAAYTG